MGGKKGLDVMGEVSSNLPSSFGSQPVTSLSDLLLPPAPTLKTTVDATILVNNFLISPTVSSTRSSFPDLHSCTDRLFSLFNLPVPHHISHPFFFFSSQTIARLWEAQESLTVGSHKVACTSRRPPRANSLGKEVRAQFFGNKPSGFT